MLNKTEQKQLEAKVGSLDLLPPHLQQELIIAFYKTLQVEKEKKRIEKKYAYPITGKKAKGRFGTVLQSNECRKQDKKHYQHPSPKMKRYQGDKAAHYGLLPGIVCSCFRDDTAAVPCPYVPDKTVGPLRQYYAKHGVWWKI